jgi:hypothetical protein
MFLIEVKVVGNANISDRLRLCTESNSDKEQRLRERQRSNVVDIDPIEDVDTNGLGLPTNALFTE